MEVEFHLDVEKDIMIVRLNSSLSREIKTKIMALCDFFDAEYTEIVNANEKLDTIIRNAVLQIGNINVRSFKDFDREIAVIFNNITTRTQAIINEKTKNKGGRLFRIRAYKTNDKVNDINELQQDRLYNSAIDSDLTFERDNIKAKITEKALGKSVFDNLIIMVDDYANNIIDLISTWDLENREKIANGRFTEKDAVCPCNFTPDMYRALGIVYVNFMSLQDVEMTGPNQRFAKLKNIAISNLYSNTSLEIEMKINALHYTKERITPVEVNRKVAAIMHEAAQIIKNAEAGRYINDIKTKFTEHIDDSMNYITREIEAFLRAKTPHVLFRHLNAFDNKYTDVVVNSETKRLIEDAIKINQYLYARVNEEKTVEIYRETAIIQLNRLFENEIALILMEDVKKRNLFAGGKFSNEASSYRPEPIASMERTLGLVPGQIPEDREISKKEENTRRNFIEYEQDLLQAKIDEGNKQLKEIKEHSKDPDPKVDDEGKPTKKPFYVKRFHPADPRYVPPVVPEFLPGKLYRSMAQPAKNDKRYIFGTMVAGKAGIDAHLMFDEIALSISLLPLTNSVFSGTLLNAVTDAINEYILLPNSNKSDEIDLDWFLENDNDRFQILFKDFVSTFVKESEMANMRVAMSTQSKLFLYTELNHRKFLFKQYVEKNRT